MTVQARPDPCGLSDLELAARIAARDRDAVRVVTERNNQRLFRVAWSVLRQRDEAEDVVQSTYMRGFESIRMFHERRPDVPVVAMSGYAFANAERAPDFLRMTIELGAACCLRKPFTQDALLTVVNQCITSPEASARLSK